MSKSKSKPSKAEATAKKAVTVASANPTLIIGTVAIVATGLILYRVAKKVDNVISYDNSDQGGGKLNPTGSITISRNQAELIASSVFRSLNQACYTNSCIRKMLQDALEALDPIRTTGDFALVSTAFGTPRFDGFVQTIWPASKRNMTYWLQTKFRNDKDLYNQLKLLIPGI